MSVEVHAEYDAEADILEVWIGEKPRAAVSVEGPGGVLTRVALDDDRVCGFTVFDWGKTQAWRDAPAPRLVVGHRP